VAEGKTQKAVGRKQQAEKAEGSGFRVLLLTCYFRLPPSSCCLLLSAYCLLLSAYCLLLSASCLLLSAYCLPRSACFLLLSACCLLPSVYCLLPSGSVASVG